MDFSGPDPDNIVTIGTDGHFAGHSISHRHKNCKHGITGIHSVGMGCKWILHCNWFCGCGNTRDDARL